MPLAFTAPASYTDVAPNPNGPEAGAVGGAADGFAWEDADGDPLALAAWWIARVTTADGDTDYAESDAQRPRWMDLALERVADGPNGESRYRVAVEVEDDVLVERGWEGVWVGHRVTDGTNAVEGAVHVLSSLASAALDVASIPMHARYDATLDNSGDAEGQDNVARMYNHADGEAPGVYGHDYEGATTKGAANLPAGWARDYFPASGERRRTDAGHPEGRLLNDGPGDWLFVVGWTDGTGHIHTQYGKASDGHSGLMHIQTSGGRIQLEPGFNRDFPTQTGTGLYDDGLPHVVHYRTDPTGRRRIWVDGVKEIDFNPGNTFNRRGGTDSQSRFNQFDELSGVDGLAIGAGCVALRLFTEAELDAVYAYLSGWRAAGPVARPDLSA